MFRSQFSKKAQNTVKTGNFKKGAVASAPSSKVVPKKAVKKLLKPKCHAGMINTLNVRSINYEEIPANGDEPAKKIVHIYFYDNLAGNSLDYVAPATQPGDQDENSSIGFKGCNYLPLFNPGNNDSDAKKHLDEIQDMYDDMVIAGEFQISDPAEDHEGGDASKVHVYDCVLHSETRTFITEDTKSLEGLEGDYLSVNYNMINNAINTSENAPKNHYLWMGFYRTSEATDPYFLKLQLIRYEIDTLYAGYGSIEHGQDGTSHGIFVEPDQETQKDVKLRLDVEQFAVASNHGKVKREGADGFTTIKKAVVTGIDSQNVIMNDNLSTEIEINTLVPPEEGEEITVVPEQVKATYVNGIPGYEVLAIKEGEEPNQTIRELQSRPVSVKMPEYLKVNTEVITGNEEAGREIAVPGCGMTVVVELDGSAKTRIKVIKSSRIEKEGEEGAENDVVAYVQNPVQPKLELIYPLVVDEETKDVVDGVVNKIKSREISHLISSIENVLIQGPIKVTNGKTGSEKVEGILQFLDDVKFIGSSFGVFNILECAPNEFDIIKELQNTFYFL